MAEVGTLGILVVFYNSKVVVLYGVFFFIIVDTSNVEITVYFSLFLVIIGVGNLGTNLGVILDA